MTDVMGAVAAAAASVSRLYSVNGVPATPTYPYATYSASLGRGDVYLNDGREGVRWGRITLQAFGKTATAADTKYEEIRAALVGTALDITGYDATPCRAELDPTPIARDPDTSGVAGLTFTLTFTATKETS